MKKGVNNHIIKVIKGIRIISDKTFDEPNIFN